MARQKFAIGAEIDILGAEDLSRSMAWWRKETRRPDVTYTSATFTVDGAGHLAPTSGDPMVLQVEPGQRAEILRAQVWDTTLTYTPGAPLTSGWIGLFRNSIVQPPAFYWPEQPGDAVLPAVWTNTDDCPRLEQQDRLIVFGTGLGATNGAQVTVQLMFRRWVFPARRSTSVTPSAS